jgi:hypothetical protein
MYTRFAMSALVLLAVAVSGCYRWSELGRPSPSIARALTQEVRVTLTDGRQMWLRSARIQQDSLVGDTAGGQWGGRLIPRKAVSVASIRSLGIYLLEPGPTVLLAGGICVAVIAMAALAIHSSGGILGGIGPMGF